ncbi:MAG TPA: Hsp20/alpha crystallin family protein [Bacteroidia bacterium]|nr:Hsp20/alpha crystallin family protein [Bacteroidia bacterium]
MSLVKKNSERLPAFKSLLSDFFESENLSMRDLFQKEWIPAVNVSETEKEYEIEMAVPGMTKNDFKVKVEDGVLSISSEKKEEKEDKKKNYTRREFSYRSFDRSFTLPENATSDDVKAKYEDGILKLSIGKKKNAVSNAKQISVK